VQHIKPKKKALTRATSDKFLLTKNDYLNTVFNIILLILGIPNVFPIVFTTRYQQTFVSILHIQSFIIFKKSHLKTAELRQGKQTAGLGSFTIEIIQTA